MRQRYGASHHPNRFSGGVNSRPPFPADVYQAAQTVCQDYAGGTQRGGGIPKVAQLMGMPPGTLYNKLNPAGSTDHKLTVQDLIQIWLITRDLRILQALARTHECVCFPVPDFSGFSDEALLDLLAKVQQEEGNYHKALREALSDGEVDAGELERLSVQLFEWIGAIVETHARVKGLVRG